MRGGIRNCVCEGWRCIMRDGACVRVSVCEGVRCIVRGGEVCVRGNTVYSCRNRASVVRKNSLYSVSSE